MKKLSNKVVWITGASSGIGEALAYALAKEGAKLILSSRRKEALEQVKGNCPSDRQQDIRILPLDLSQIQTLGLITEAAIQFFGHVDILINNGGLRQRSLIRDTPFEVDRQIMEVNYLGTIALTKHLLPHFTERKIGHYVTISSITGKFGTPYRSAYAASKHALHGFFDSLRAEMWQHHITVTLICPGFIKTTQHKPSPDEGVPAKSSPYVGKSPDWLAAKIIQAIKSKKEEVYYGGREVFGVYIKRFFPKTFSRLIRSVAVR
jgi:short-subunit dehydrogenase